MYKNCALKFPAIIATFYPQILYKIKFNLYSVNITARIPFFIKAIHKTAGIMTQNESEQAVQQKIDEVFQEMDKNHDEKISLQEFIESTSQDRSLISVLELNYDIQ